MIIPIFGHNPINKNPKNTFRFLLMAGASLACYACHHCDNCCTKLKQIGIESKGGCSMDLYVYHPIEQYRELFYFNNTLNKYKVVLVKYMDSLLPDDDLLYIRLQVPTITQPIVMFTLDSGDYMKIYTVKKKFYF
jgi:hypothetical protein